MLALGVLLTAGSAVFVTGEFCLVTVDPATVEAGGVRQGWRYRSLLRAHSNLALGLSSAQLGVTVTTILFGYTAQPAVDSLLSALLGATPLVPWLATAIAVVLGLLLVNLFSMLFGELIPKKYALSNPYRTALHTVPVVRGFARIARPLIWVLLYSANGILRILGIEPREQLSSARTPDELRSLVQHSADEGTLDEHTATLLTNSIELAELSARDVMTDRMRVNVIPRDATAQDVIAVARKGGHSRFPVIGEDRDDVLGIVTLRRAVAVPYEKRAEVPAAALMVEAPRVPETVRLGPLLVELRSFGVQIAVVVDEYGGTSGIVTLEDVIEELVGDVADEHDRRRAAVRRAADGSWLLPGVTRPDELREQTGLQVPEDAAYETLAGLIMARLGRLPVVGDEIEVDDHGQVVALKVAAMSGRRVERVRVSQR